MSAYIKLSTLEYPRYEGDIRLEHPDISESQTGDSFPCPNTYAPVVWIDPPQYSFEQRQYVVEIAPECVSGIWEMRWEVRVMDEDTFTKIKMELQSIGNPLGDRINKPGSTPDVIE